MIKILIILVLLLLIIIQIKGDIVNEHMTQSSLKVENNSSLKNLQYTNDPDYNQYTNDPDYNQYTNDPDYNQYTNDPDYNQYSIEPNYNQYSIEPNYNQYSIEPNYNQYSIEPNYNQYSIEPNNEQRNMIYNSSTLPNLTSYNRDFYQNLSVCNNSVLSKFQDYSLYNGLIEITDLPLFRGSVVANYQVNVNSINNNSTSIFQEILDPLLSTCEINSNNYNLINVEFRKSKFSYNSNGVGLELHLVHTNYDALPNYNIIIPLDLVNDPSPDITENFINVLYKKMDSTVNTFENEFANITDETQLDATILKNNNTNNRIQKEKNMYNLNLNYRRPYDINSVTVNQFINKENLVVNYECCGTIIGNMKQFNLCLLNTIINSMSNFRVIQDRNSDRYLLGEPIPFNEDIGLLMRSNLNDNPNITYVKSN